MYDICIYKYTYVKYNINASNTSRNFLVPRAIHFFTLYSSNVYHCRAQTFPLYSSLHATPTVQTFTFAFLITHKHARAHTHMHADTQRYIILTRMHTCSTCWFDRLLKFSLVNCLNKSFRRIVIFKRRRNAIARLFITVESLKN